MNALIPSAARVELIHNIELELPNQKQKKKGEPFRMGKFSFTVTIVLLAVFIQYWMPCRYVPQVDEEYLVQNLSSTVFGQELAIRTFASALRDHMKNLKAGVYKPLILSFHGSSGFGKTFLSSQISLILNGTFAPVYYPSIHNKRGDFEIKTSNWFDGFSRYLEWNVFIIDDAQQLTEEFKETFEKKLQAIKGTCDERKLIVIFLSNLYGREINEKVLDIKRVQRLRSFDESDFHSIIASSPSNYFVELHKKNLLDDFVPFLPLDRNSVGKCIKQELIRLQQIPHREIVEEILNHIMVEKHLPFSNSGCKNVAHKVALWLNSEL